MSRTKLLKMIFLGTFPVILVVLALFLFREEAVVNPVLGEITYKWRWGFAREMIVDSDRDGRRDIRAIFDFKSRYFFTHDTPTEYWEDRDSDGSFDCYAHWRPDGTSIVELDTDGDGKFDETLTDVAAEQFFRKRVKALDQGDPHL